MDAPVPSEAKTPTRRTITLTLAEWLVLRDEFMPDDHKKENAPITTTMPAQPNYDNEIFTCNRR
jgi:hypothetical protein